MPTTAFVILIVHVTLVCMQNTSPKTTSEPCEYDLDLTKNTVKITCQGSPSVVNVYADKALVQADENIKNSFVENTNTRPISGSSGSESLNIETTGSRPHPERPSSSRPGFLNTGDPLAFQKDRQEMAFKYAGSFADVVGNASMKLDKAKQSLSTYTDSIKNITVKLTEGDLLLRSDMEKLKRTSNSATDLKGGIIAAMTNQYNFMRSALLARNYELEKLVMSLNVLVDVTADGLQSALMAHRMAMEEVAQVNMTLLAVKRMVSKELMKLDPTHKDKGSNNEHCPKEISAIGSGSYKLVTWSTGAYMVQSVHPSEFRSVYITEGTGPVDQLMEYHAPVDVEPDLVARYFILPFSCSGTGHVVYRRHFYCHKHDSNLIVKYHLKKMDLIAEVALPGAMFGNTAPYSSGENTDIDLAVDELGLWAIYATKDSAGNMVISQIDHKKMEIQRTWRTSYAKKQIGNAFMICGVLYAVNSHKDTPTYIRYIYNTDTNKEQTLEKGEIAFLNSALLGMSDMAPMTVENKSSNTVMLSYDYRTSSLYSWNNKRIEVFPLYFRKKN
uniref:Olfactomedin-like domain-containing protein n=1 Tax=Arion vulgaris TaxID=1028688 RepID=A0A0B7AKT6_9EUPU